MTARILSASAAIFAVIVERSSAAHLARALGVDESAVRHWASGRRVPSDAMKDRLTAFDARLSADGWVDVTPATKAPENRSSRESQPDVAELAPPTTRETDGEGRLLEVIRQCDELLVEASDPDSHASVRDRTAILAAKTTAVVRLSRIRGDDALSVGKILASPHWRAIWKVVLDVLEKRAPDALKEICERLDADERRERA